ncbi:MAG: T9SS type A sorting domain-containing protein [Bacteroidetes bacterium]|nr:T9SS type A sorting domain-containing protein [Bacteroidota bacterium]
MWQIRTICDTVGVDLVSAFSAVQNFTTAVCREEIAELTNAEMLLYPNPATNTSTIILPESGKYTCNILNMTGEIVYNEQFDIILKGESINLNLQNLSAGIYLVRVYNDMIQYTDQLVIQK